MQRPLTLQDQNALLQSRNVSLERRNRELKHIITLLQNRISELTEQYLDLLTRESYHIAVRIEDRQRISELIDSQTHLKFEKSQLRLEVAELKKKIEDFFIEESLNSSEKPDLREFYRHKKLLYETKVKNESLLAEIKKILEEAEKTSHERKEAVRMFHALQTQHLILKADKINLQTMLSRQNVQGQIEEFNRNQNLSYR